MSNGGNEFFTCQLSNKQNTSMTPQTYNSVTSIQRLQYKHCYIGDPTWTKSIDVVLFNNSCYIIYNQGDKRT